jgi:hypothetical protein
MTTRPWTATQSRAVDAYRDGWLLMAVAAALGGLLMLAARLASPPGRPEPAGMAAARS